jgi:transcription factor MYB, plant
MARQAAGAKKKLRRGLWSPEEDEKLMNHIAKYGLGCWSSVAKLAGNNTELPPKLIQLRSGI